MPVTPITLPGHAPTITRTTLSVASTRDGSTPSVPDGRLSFACFSAISEDE